MYESVFDAMVCRPSISANGYVTPPPCPHPSAPLYCSNERFLVFSAARHTTCEMPSPESIPFQQTWVPPLDRPRRVVRVTGIV
jgi:hypothetical protein